MKPYTFNACSCDEALAMASDVVTIAKGRKLCPAIIHSLGEVKAQRSALETIIVSRDHELEASGGAGVRTPMLAARSVFATLAEILRGLAEQPIDTELADKARDAYAALFPHGTSFLAGTAFVVDIQGARVLEHAREEDNASILDEIDCTRLVKIAHKAHSDLRAARQASASIPEDADGTTVQAALTSLIGALRGYATVVQAVDVVDGTSLRKELLAPFANRRLAVKRTPPTSPDPPAPLRTFAVEMDEVPPSRAA